MNPFGKKPTSQRGLAGTPLLLAFALSCLVTLITFSAPLQAAPALQALPAATSLRGHGEGDWHATDLGNL